MKLAAAAAAGLVVGRLAWILLRPAFAHPALDRENYRGRHLPTAAGVVIPIAVLAVEAGRVVAGRGPGPNRVAVVLVVCGLGLVGLLDDLAGTGDARGFRGHLVALARGRLTTGGAKLLGGAAVALIAASVVDGDIGIVRVLVDGAVIALAANLGNLFDRAPGRVIKVGTVAGLLLAVGTGGAVALTGVMVVAGASLALLPEDLHEQLMVGDTGANALGGALGLGLVLTLDETGRVVTLVALVLANLASEVVSFSRVIDAVPPLRMLDRAGRRP